MRIANSAAAKGPRSSFIVVGPLHRSVPGKSAALLRLIAGDVVGLDPARRSDREAALGPGRHLASGPEVAAHESRLRGREVGMCEIVLDTVRHREMALRISRFRLARHR